MIDQLESFILNRYAASELAGALLLGKMARKTTDSYLRRQYTWHCAEEARHAAVWEGLIDELNVGSIVIHDEKSKSYFSYFSEVKTSIDFLAFLHVYELRVPFHFQLHAKWTTSDRIKEVLNQLIDEEASHLSWVKDILIKELETKHDEVIESLRKFSDIEEKTYVEDVIRLKSRSDDSASFGNLIMKSLPTYEGVFADGVFK